MYGAVVGAQAQLAVGAEPDICDAYGSWAELVDGCVGGWRVDVRPKVSWYDRGGTPNVERI